MVATRTEGMSTSPGSPYGAWVYSLSGSAPHLFADRRVEFEPALRHLLQEATPSGLFAEWLPDTEVFVWRTPQR